MSYAVKVRDFSVDFRLASDEGEVLFRNLIGLDIAHLAVIVAVADGCIRWISGVRDFDVAAETAA